MKNRPNADKLETMQIWHYFLLIQDVWWLIVNQLYSMFFYSSVYLTFSYKNTKLKHSSKTQHTC